MTAGTLSLMASEWEGAPGMPFEWGSNPDLWLYRDRTLGLLYRYFKLSMEAGRLPSILGQEFFRNQITSYSVSSFEDVVIFVHDVAYYCHFRSRPRPIRKLVKRASSTKNL
jgi:hypothetical protein